MDREAVAGVAGLPDTSNINGCDAFEPSKHPTKGPANPGHCRTSRPIPAEVIDKGKKVLRSFPSMADAYVWAEAELGAENQDRAPHGEDPNGWDIQVAGVDR